MAKLDQDLLKEYRQLAKRADQRLVRLEQAAQQPGYSNATKWAYRAAQKDIRKWGGENAKRFNIAPPATNRELQAKIDDIKIFLESKTSTKKGITAVYKKTSNTFNQKYGTNFTNKSFTKFWDSGFGDKIKSNYGSETAFKALGKITLRADKIVKAIKETDKNVKIETGDKIIDEIISQMIKDNGKDILDFFS